MKPKIIENGFWPKGESTNMEGNELRE